MKPWIIIPAITFLVSLGSWLIRPREDLRWVKRLEQPHWLSQVEPFIPFIWTVIFICGAVSAVLVWQHDPGSLQTVLLMGLYLLVEIITVAYIPLTLRLRSLAIGTLLGGSAAVLGLGLTIAVAFQSIPAALLLVPFVIWSPIGTYATRELIDFNPEAI